MPSSLGTGLSVIWLAMADDGGGTFNFGIELEDNSGIIQLEAGGGFIELESGP